MPVALRRWQSLMKNITRFHLFLFQFAIECRTGGRQFACILLRRIIEIQSSHFRPLALFDPNLQWINPHAHNPDIGSSYHGLIVNRQ